MPSPPPDAGHPAGPREGNAGGGHISRQLADLLASIQQSGGSRTDSAPPRDTPSSSARRFLGLGGFVMALVALGLCFWLFPQWQATDASLKALRQEVFAPPSASPAPWQEPLQSLQAALTTEQAQRKAEMGELLDRANGWDATLENIQSSPYLNPTVAGADPKSGVTQGQFTAFRQSVEGRLKPLESLAKEQEAADKALEKLQELAEAQGKTLAEIRKETEGIGERLQAQEKSITGETSAREQLAEDIAAWRKTGEEGAAALEEWKTTWEKAAVDLAASRKEDAGKIALLEKSLEKPAEPPEAGTEPKAPVATAEPGLAQRWEDLSCEVDALRQALEKQTATTTAPSAPPAEKPGAGMALADVREDQKKLMADIKALQESLAGTKTLATEVETLRRQLAATKPDELIDAQLLYLKERDRLNAYADKAIGSGDRPSWDQLLSVANGPQTEQRLRDAALAELYRVRAFYLSGPRLADFTIPVDRLFPDNPPPSDEKLQPPQLAGLMLDPKMDWRIRSRAAFLMGRIRHPDAAKALLEVVKSDQNLDVVRDAMYAFSVLTGYRGEVFDVAALVGWWAREEDRVLAELRKTP
jgi:hypothetical protein